MDYAHALAALHKLQSFGVRPGLLRIRELLRRLGNPEQCIPHYIHIAGTNGKGSVAAMLDSMLRAGGVKSGLFTSPHLQDHRERYRVSGELISEENFALIFSEVDAMIRAMAAEGLENPTEFEAATAVALLFFARSGVETAVMEAGMGGGLDSTNVITAEIAVLTAIGYDHMQYIGSTLADIAREKSGIIKPGASVVSAGQPPDAMAVIAAACRERGAQLQYLGRDISVMQLDMTDIGSSFSLQTARAEYSGLFQPLLGRHQVQNAALAVTAAEAAGLTPEAIRAGLKRVVWPGRLEMLSRRPLVLLDGAHNQPGMAVLAQALRDYWPGKRVLALLGMLADKQREQAMAEILPDVSAVLITPPPNERRGDWQQLAVYAQQAGVQASCIADNRAAAEAALTELCHGYDLLLVAGSLYLLADMRRYLLEGLA